MHYPRLKVSLTAGMLDYAAQDTRYLLDLRDELRSRLE